MWERIGGGESVATSCESLPDEFRAWVEAVAAELVGTRDTVLQAAVEVFERTVAETRTADGVVDRKAFAALAQGSEHRPWLLMLLDGKDPPTRCGTPCDRADFRPMATPDEDAP